jgi:hypothetical protein
VASELVAGSESAECATSPDSRESHSIAEMSNDFDGDVFLSHATEDKDDIARPLATALTDRGLRVWYDEFVLEMGDSLRESIDRGLAISEFGVVILSPQFFAKRWTSLELNGLVTREVSELRQIILPVWHNVDRDAVAKYSLLLADRKATPSSLGVGAVADRIVKAIRRARDGGDGRRVTGLLPTTSPQRHPTSESEKVQFVWHPKVHQILGQATMQWILLRYRPAISPEKVQPAIREALQEANVAAYSLETLFGPFDGLLQAWVPIEGGQALLRSKLSAPDSGIAECRTFAVWDILRDWVWRVPGGVGLREPDHSMLGEGGPARHIASAVQHGVQDNPHLEHLIAAGLLARVAVDRGIRFAVAFADGERSAHNQREYRHQLLKEIADNAEGINGPALYRGDGFASHLFVGRVPVGEYQRLETDVVRPARDVAERTEARTLTVLGSAERPALYREEVKVA